MFSTTQQFQYVERLDHTIAVKTNGGSVSVQVKVGNDWVVTDTIASDGARIIYTDNLLFRVVPSGGAVYTLSGE